MPNVTFARQYKVTESAETDRVYPAGWRGNVSRDVAAAASKAGVLESSAAKSTAGKDEDRQPAIVAAIGKLGKDGLTDKGVPKTEALQAITGFSVSAKERDEAFEAYRKANPDLFK